LFVASSDLSTPSEAVQGSLFSQQRLASYARLVSGRDLSSRVIQETGVDTTPALMAQRLSAVPVPDTVLIDVTVTASSPEEAQRIAQAVGSQFPGLVAELETSPGKTAESPARVAVVEEPELPAAPTSPNPIRNVAVGVILGALVGLAQPVIRSVWDRSVRFPEDVHGLGCGPVIATLVHDEAFAAGPHDERSSNHAVAESFRQLRNRLIQDLGKGQPRAVMVTSAGPEEGRSMVAVNLALAVAETGRRVVLVEADLRHPSLARRFSLPEEVGLAQVLSGEADLGDVLVGAPGGDGNVSFITAGGPPTDPGQLFSTELLAVLVDQLREKNDFVLVDMAPLLPYADATGLAARVDGVVLTVRYGRTRKERVAEAAAVLESLGARTLGVVLTMVPPSSAAATGATIRR
jgi:receptor protein-tyrosine kinase